MRIFITGATGFVGKHVARYLGNEHHSIIALCHDMGQMANFEFSIDSIVQGDVRDYKRMREILLDYKPDVIVHLAAQATVAQAQTDPYTTFDVNVGGTIALLNAYRDALPNAYFLYFSSDKVYGNGLNKKETDPVQASGFYESSKAAADLIAQTYMPNHTIAVTRTCNIYGPGDRNRTRIIPSAICDDLLGIVSRGFMHNGQTSVREYIYVEDVSRAIEQLISERRVGIWNIGSGQVLTTKELRSKIGRHTFIESPYPELMEQSLNSDKFNAIRRFDFTSIDDGLRKTKEWWKQQVSLS